MDTVYTVSLKWIFWTFGNKERLFLLEFDVLLKHPDTLVVSWQNFAHGLLPFLLIVPCWCDFNLEIIQEQETFAILYSWGGWIKQQKKK